MNLYISTQRYRIIWDEVWRRLDSIVQNELSEFLGNIDEIPAYTLNRTTCRHVYGVYSEGKISLCREDLETLSDVALTGVVAHELGHAYCHLKGTTPSPCAKSIEAGDCLMHAILTPIPCPNYGCILSASEQGANLVAQAWGFQNELWALEHERRVPEGI